MKISEFAALSGISRELLIFYDKSGILHPKWVDPVNGYRYYSYRQIDTASVIVSFRRADIPLESIRDYLLRRSPEHLLEILSQQERTLDRQIQKLRQVRGVVRARLEQTRRGLNTSARDCIMIALARRADHSLEVIRRIRHRLKRLHLIRLFCCPRRRGERDCHGLSERQSDTRIH